MRKTFLSFLFLMTTLFAIEKSSTDCSEIPDWLMSDADKKHLCNKPSKTQATTKQLSSPVSDDTQMGTVHSLDPNGDGFLSIRNKVRGKEIGKLYNGNKVKILSKKGKYYKVKKVSSGTVGYAHSNWIRKTSSTSSANTSTTSSNKEGVVHGLDPNGDGFLALRAKYKTGRQIGKLYEGNRVKILAKRGKWYKVKTVSAGQVGWAHGTWVKVNSIKKKSKKEIQQAHKLEVLAMIKDDPENIKLWSIQDKKNKKLVLQAARIHGLILKYIDIDDYKKDKDVSLEAVKSNYSYVPKYLDNALLKDRDFVMTAVKYLNNVLSYADVELRKDKEVVLIAVKHDGRALEYAHEDLKKDKEVVLESVKSNGLSLEYADSSVKNIDIVVFSAINNHPGALIYTNKRYLQDTRILKYIKIKPSSKNHMKYAIGKGYYYVTCLKCHGENGSNKALGVSGKISNLSNSDLIKKLKKYKNANYNQYGFGGLMKGNVRSLPDATLDALALYISNLKNNESEVFSLERSPL